LARTIKEKEELAQSLQEKALALEKQNAELLSSRANETAFRREAEAWASVEIIDAVVTRNVRFPIRRDLVCITYDIVNSSIYHEKSVDGIGVRGHILNLFTAALLKYGGIPECHGGDAAFGHFGAFSDMINASTLALAVAQDFRVGLRNLERIHQITVECGIAIHIAKQALIQVHEVQVESGTAQRTKKFLSSASAEIDFLFRIEKLTHQLPGSNIIFSAPIASTIKDQQQQKVVPLGCPKIGEKSFAVECFMIPSYFVKDEMIAEFIKKSFPGELKKSA